MEPFQVRATDGRLKIESKDFATPGEFEPASFCVSARVDLGTVKLETGRFVDEKTKQP